MDAGTAVQGAVHSAAHSNAVQGAVHSAIDAVLAEAKSSEETSTRLAALIEAYITNQNTHAIKEFLHLTLEGEGRLRLFARACLQQLVLSIKRLPNALQKDVATYCLDKLDHRGASFRDEEVMLRRLVSQSLADEGEYVAAARVLAATDFQSLSPITALDSCTTIADLHLKSGDAVTAEQYISRASTFALDVNASASGSISDSAYKSLTNYLTICAATSAERLKPLEAAAKCMESVALNDRHTTTQFNADDGNTDNIAHATEALLQGAVLNTVLSPQCLQKTRLVQNLLQDPRCSKIVHYSVLQKVEVMGYLNSEDVQSLTGSVPAAYLRSSETIPSLSFLAVAVAQHNVEAIAKNCESVSVSFLSGVLGVDQPTVEDLAVDLIARGNFNASIDQERAVIRLLDNERTAKALFDRRVNKTLALLDAAATKIRLSNSATDVQC